MDAVVKVVSAMVFVLLGFSLMGGPMFLADWLRARRQDVIARQITLTDALDGRFGVLVAPVVTKPLFGPWEVRIAVPLQWSAIQGGMLAVIDEVFVRVDGTNPSSYRIVLSVTPDGRRAAGSGSSVKLHADTLASAVSR
ncbi:MAG TPA: hypothetical protein VI669_09085 [Vicinamibacteria bacterium]|jgi:hypothetical protein